MPPEVAARHFDAMGTTCSLFGAGQSAAGLADGERWVRDVAARLTRFSKESELSRLNAASGRWVTVSPYLADVLRAALRAHESSGGLVNAAVLSAMKTAGYTRPLVERPPVATLERGAPAPSLAEVLEMREGEARLLHGAGVDLGGIAKGWMADRLCETLGPNVVVNLGGDLRAVGPGPRGAGWPVQVAGMTLLLRDQGAATSSTRRRRWDGGHHLIDPRTGLPSASGLEQVSVVAETAFDAEVVAKTALLLGPELAAPYCAAHALAWSLDGPHDG
jgi:FAD:protein FMN transferase